VIDEKAEPFYDEIVRRNQGEAEFHQAVREVLESLGPVLTKYPEFTEHKIIERICEPERQIIFRFPGATTGVRCTSTAGSGSSSTVPWGRTRAVYASTRRCIGDREVPRLRAGLQDRADRHAARRRQGRLGLDPKGKSDDEVMAFCQSFMTELYRHLGEYTAVPAGDIGVGVREIGYLFG
jgi:glutamate dehydrogenase (NADP+)